MFNDTLLQDHTSRMAARPFTKPEFSQEQSHFLQIPAELRLKILRLLSKKDKVLMSIKETYETNGPSWQDEASTWYDELQLSSQLLLTCQILYREAYNVLYCENELGIYCTEINRNEISSFVFDTMDRKVLKTRWSIHSPLVDSIESSRLFAVYVPSPNSVCKLPEDRLEVVRKFHRFQVHFREYDDERLPRQVCSVCMTWSVILRNKHVRFRVRYQSFTSYSSITTAILEPCRMLRCKTFEFLGMPRDMMLSKQRLIEQSTNYDTLLMWQRFMHDVIHKLPCGKDKSFED